MKDVVVVVVVCCCRGVCISPAECRQKVLAIFNSLFFFFKHHHLFTSSVFCCRFYTFPFIGTARFFSTASLEPNNVGEVSICAVSVCKSAEFQPVALEVSSPLPAGPPLRPKAALCSLIFLLQLIAARHFLQRPIMSLLPN